MGTQPRECKRSDIEHVRRFVAYAKSVVNETRYYPPAHGYRYMLALVLYSKCITVAEAILVLLDAGFGDEAFGMTRTLVDIFIALRYIANKDADERAKRYAEFAAKSSAVWNEVTELYWPHRVQILDEHTKRLAATYKSPHQWSGETAKTMALEPDTVDVDPDTGEPANHSVAYSITYRWTSHNVHPPIGALRKHMVQAARDHFVVHSGRVQDMAHLVVFNTASGVASTMISFYRCMGDPQPQHLSDWAGALMRHLARRHRGLGGVQKDSKGKTKVKPKSEQSDLWLKRPFLLTKGKIPRSGNGRCFLFPKGK